MIGINSNQNLQEGDLVLIIGSASEWATCNVGKTGVCKMFVKAKEKVLYAGRCWEPEVDSWILEGESLLAANTVRTLVVKGKSLTGRRYLMKINPDAVHDFRVEELEHTEGETA